MKNRIVILILSVLFICQNFGLAGESNDGNLPGQKEIIKIIEKLNQAASNLKNLSAKIEYIHAQPLFETQTIRTGKVFYIKDVNYSALRINFMTIKQDDSAEQNYREDYIFDGRKMTKIDYQSKSATSEQLAKENKIEPFELVQDYFPIIGFAKPDKLAQQFDIKLQQKTNKQNFITLLLIPKENSGFSKTYKQVEIRIDSKNFLPFDFSAVTSEDEKITIKLTRIDISTVVDKGVFDMVIPADFVQMQK
jgi:outer membrane lipoprotein-sorting protein